MSVAASVGPLVNFWNSRKKGRWIAIQKEAGPQSTIKQLYYGVSTIRRKIAANWTRASAAATSSRLTSNAPEHPLLHFPQSATNNNKIENQTSTIQAPSARLAVSALSLAHRSSCPNLCGGWKDAAEGVEYSSFFIRKAHCCYPLALITPPTGWEIPRRSWTRMGGIQFSGWRRE